MTPPPRLALAFILATVTLDAIGIGLIFPVMPNLIEDLTGGTLAEAALWGGLLSTSYAVMQFLFGPFIGALSDRYGRRPVLLISLAVMALDYVAMALAPGVALLLAARIVAGITAATYATATAFIADITPPADRGRRFGLVGAGFGMGFVLGPVIGGLLATIDLRAPFYVAAALAGANLIFGLIVLPETVTPENRRALSVARANPLGALLAVTRLARLRLPLLTFFIFSVAMNIYPAIWAYYGLANFGWGPTMIGVSLAVYGLSFALGQAFLVGPVIRRLGESRAVLWGFILDLLALLIYGITTSGTLAIALTPVAALAGIATPALQAMLSRDTPANAQGELQGVLASLSAVAMITAPMVMTSTFAAFTAPGAAIHAPGAPFLLAALLMVAAIGFHVAGTRATAPQSP